MSPAGPARQLEPTPPPLQDAQGRTIRYLRLSITDRCNFRCLYCSPAPAKERADLSLAELTRLVRAFADLGIDRVRLTGGEPLFRKEVVEIARDAATTPGIREVCLSTNGSNLATLAEPLRRAGVRKINVSLDSLDPERFARISQGGRLPEVLEGLEAARAAGIAELAVNAVVLRGVNEDDPQAIVRWCWARGITPRFIELMPFAEGVPVSIAEIQAKLAAAGLPLRRELGRSDGRGPATYFEGEHGRVGFIGALTKNFCQSCNRLRVSTRGELQACLGGSERVPLAPLLGEGIPTAHLEREIRAALGRKEEGHHFLEPRVQGRLLSMMGIGG